MKTATKNYGVSAGTRNPQMPDGMSLGLIYGSVDKMSGSLLRSESLGPRPPHRCAIRH